jgi:hypothetical protein
LDIGRQASQVFQQSAGQKQFSYVDSSQIQVMSPLFPFFGCCDFNVNK